MLTVSRAGNQKQAGQSRLSRRDPFTRHLYSEGGAAGRMPITGYELLSVGSVGAVPAFLAKPLAGRLGAVATQRDCVHGGVMSLILACEASQG